MERGVWRAGNWIAGASGAALLISLFLPWYGMFTGIVCVQAPCPTFSFASGWQALGVEAAFLVGAAGLGVALPGLALAKARPALGRKAVALATGAGALATIVVVLRLNVPPGGLDDVLDSVRPRREAEVLPEIGAYLALAGAVGVCGGAGLSLTGHASGRLAPLADVSTRLLPVAAGAGLLATLFVPWFQVEVVRALSPGTPPHSSYNVWDALPFSDLLVVTVAVAIVAASLAAALTSSPRLYLAVALLGLLGLVGTLFSATRPVIALPWTQVSADVGLLGPGSPPVPRS